MQIQEIIFWMILEKKPIVEHFVILYMYVYCKNQKLMKIMRNL